MSEQQNFPPLPKRPLPPASRQQILEALVRDSQTGETGTPAAATGLDEASTRAASATASRRLTDYSRWAESLWVKGGNGLTTENSLHAVTGLAEEVGEVVGLFKRQLRGDAGGLDYAKLEKELGDVIYYWVRLCTIHGFDPEDILLANIKKLEDRRSRGTLKGSGDNR